MTGRTGPIEPISPGQYFWVVSVSIVTGGIYLWPQFVVSTAGTDALLGWIPPLGLMLLLTLLQCRWAGRIGARSYAEGLARTWGRWMAMVLVPVNVLMIALVDIILLHLYGDLLVTFFYPFTPIVVLIGAVAATAAWTAMRPLSVVARSAQFWLPILLATVLMLLAMATQNANHWAALHPQWPPNLSGMGDAGIGTWYLYANGGIPAGLYMAVRHPRAAHAARWAVAAVFMDGVVLFLLLVVILATLGPTVVDHLSWPIVYTLSLVDLRDFFLTGVGLFTLIIWSTSMVLFLSLHLYQMSWNLLDTTGIPRKPLVWMLAAVLVVGALVISSTAEARTLLFLWASPLELGWTVFIVGGSSLLVWMRGSRSAPA
jgi:hypothetical protein